MGPAPKDGKILRLLQRCEGLRPDAACFAPRTTPRSSFAFIDGTMLGRLFIVMFLAFLIEGWVLIQIVSATSFLFTLLLCIFTTFVGITLLRGAASRIHYEAQKALAETGSVAGALSGGLLQLLAGILLVMPGVITDVIGAALMLPPFHSIAKKRAKASRFVREGQFGNIQFGTQFTGFSAQGPTPKTHAKASNHATPPPSTAEGVPDADAPPEGDTYVPPRATNPDGVVLDAEIIDEP